MVTATLVLFYEKLEEFAASCNTKFKWGKGREVVACCRDTRAVKGKDGLERNQRTALTREQAGINWVINKKLARHEHRKRSHTVFESRQREKQISAMLKWSLDHFWRGMQERWR